MQFWHMRFIFYAVSADLRVNAYKLNSFVKPALYSSTLVIKPFKSIIKLKLLLQHYRPAFFYKLHNSHGMPIFKTEAICLVRNVRTAGYCERNSKYSITLLFFGSNS